jgi:hypothetical protein
MSGRLSTSALASKSPTTPSRTPRASVPAGKNDAPSVPAPKAALPVFSTKKPTKPVTPSSSATKEKPKASNGAIGPDDVVTVISNESTMASDNTTVVSSGILSDISTAAVTVATEDNAEYETRNESSTEEPSQPSAVQSANSGGNGVSEPSTSSTPKAKPAIGTAANGTAANGKSSGLTVSTTGRKSVDPAVSKTPTATSKLSSVSAKSPATSSASKLGSTPTTPGKASVAKPTSASMLSSASPKTPTASDRKIAANGILLKAAITPASLDSAAAMNDSVAASVEEVGDVKPDTVAIPADDQDEQMNGGSEVDTTESVASAAPAAGEVVTNESEPTSLSIPVADAVAPMTAGSEPSSISAESAIAKAAAESSTKKPAGSLLPKTPTNASPIKSLIPGKSMPSSLLKTPSVAETIPVRLSLPIKAADNAATTRMETPSSGTPSATAVVVVDPGPNESAALDVAVQIPTGQSQGEDVVREAKEDTALRINEPTVESIHTLSSAAVDGVLAPSSDTVTESRAENVVQPTVQSSKEINTVEKPLAGSGVVGAKTPNATATATPITP